MVIFDDTLINQSINQSLFQAEAHRTTNTKENANTGNRTEQTHSSVFFLLFAESTYTKLITNDIGL